MALARVGGPPPGETPPTEVTCIDLFLRRVPLIGDGFRGYGVTPEKCGFFRLRLGRRVTGLHTVTHSAVKWTPILLAPKDVIPRDNQTTASI